MPPHAPGTLDPIAFSVTNYDDDDGWSELDIKAVSVQADGSIKVDLKETPDGLYVRFIAYGTGPAPLLAKDNYQPLGAPGVGYAAPARLRCDLVGGFAHASS